MGESTPRPVDVSKLRGILSGAKNIMNKVNSGDYTTGNIQLPEVNGHNLVESIDGNYAPEPTQNTYQQNRNVNTSKLPPAILEAMMKNPIPQPTINHTFSLDDVSDLMEKPIPTAPTRMNESIRPPQSMGNIDEATIQKMVNDAVKEELMKFMTETFTKRLTEETIKKTINTLIREGKITTKKRI